MKVIVVSTSTKSLPLFKEMLKNSNLKGIIQVPSVIDAKQKLRQEDYDLVIIQTPCQDEFGTKGALEIARSYRVSVLLLVKNSIYDQVSYQVRESDVFVVSLPSTAQVLYQSIQFSMVHRNMIIQMEKEIQKHKKKLQDEKIIMRAKLFLIENYHWTEDKAHHFIEKMAMDSSKTKLLVSKEILDGKFRKQND